MGGHRTPRRRKPYPGLVDLIGNTPLIPLRRVTRLPPAVEVYGKAEWFNPGGSVKDRAALAMVRAAESSGLLTPDRILLDATSGNTGIALAMVGAALGYRVVLCVPKNASDSRKRTLRAFGTEIVWTDPSEGTDGAQTKAKEIAAEDPQSYLYLDQYNNEANWRAHYEGTATEIWRQTAGRVTHFVAGLGTTGTFVGTARRLKELDPGIRCIAFQPDAPLHGMEGLKHLETALVPGIWDPTTADEMHTTSTEEAQAWARRLAKSEGVLAGTSSGGAVSVAVRVARSLRKGVVVAVLPDGGDRYLEDRYWEDGA